MFMAGFSVITNKLKEMYQMITLGGDAELELVDRLNPFSEGIVFSVRPPKKSWKNISNLSGGEKTLSSLALVFALHHFKPTPLYVMDEIDAALDFKNVSIVANYIKVRPAPQTAGVERVGGGRVPPDAFAATGTHEERAVYHYQPPQQHV
jgi:structural maintenance of chromosome 4